MTHLQCSALLLALALAPAALLAQGRGGRGRPPAGSSEQPAQTAPRTPAPPLKTLDLLLVHQGDLALADSQVNKITTIKLTLDQQDRPLEAQLDSLRASGSTDPTQSMSDQDRAALGDRFRAMSRATTALHEHEQQARSAALAVLTSDQRKKAEHLEEQARTAAQDAERGADQPSRGGKGRGGRGGPPPGGTGGPPA